jgi:hypothetical protein
MLNPDLPPPIRTYAECRRAGLAIKKARDALIALVVDEEDCLTAVEIEQAEALWGTLGKKLVLAVEGDELVSLPEERAR